MSLWVPPVAFTEREANWTTAQASGTLVVASSTTHTKGSYAEIFASTAFDAYAIEIVFSDVAASTVARAALVDIAIGAAAAEEVIIPNLNAGCAGGWLTGAGHHYRFPVLIPAGSRLSGRGQCSTASQQIRTSITLFGEPTGPCWTGSQVVDYGTDLATSRGVSVAQGLQAEGSWTQIVASTTQDHYNFNVGIGGAGDTTMEGESAALDVGIGAAAEEVIAENLFWTTTTSEALRYTAPFAFDRSVPSGTRLAARIYGGNAFAQSFDVILYGTS